MTTGAIARQGNTGTIVGMGITFNCSNCGPVRAEAGKTVLSEAPDQPMGYELAVVCSVCGSSHKESVDRVVADALVACGYGAPARDLASQGPALSR